MSTQEISQNEFPFNINLKSKLHKFEWETKKLYGFFNYVSKYHYGKVRPINRRDYVLAEFEEADIHINRYGEVTISAVSLHIEIKKFPADGYVWVHGYAGWLDFEILYFGDYEIKTKKGGVVLKLIPKSRPEINIK